MTVTNKEPFDIDRAIAAVRGAVEPYPPAALFELYDEGFVSLFEILVACLISIRTRDEVMIVIARRFFERARTPEAVAALEAEEIVELLNGSQFPGPKAKQILGIARSAVENGGELPCDYERLLELSGVGPKCANLSLGIACGAASAPHVGVDIHVHRVTNRWGYVEASSPEATMTALDSVLPKKYKVEINKLLVPFGKHICTGVRPHCSECPVLSMCRQVGVVNPR